MSVHSVLMVTQLDLKNVLVNVEIYSDKELLL